MQGHPRGRAAIGRVLVGVAAALALAACGGEPEVVSDEVLVPVPAPSPATPTTPPELIGTTSLPQGKALVDGRGHTLYVFADDTVAKDGAKAVPACVDACAKTWPPALSASGMPVALAGVDASALGVVLRPDGAKQITLGGRPLYLHSGDTAPGQANGAGKDAKWTLAPAA